VKVARLAPVLVLTGCLVGAGTWQLRASAGSEREPVGPGKFYPASAATLRLAIESFMDDALPPRTGKPVAIIAPHAGYIYSGQIAADAFRQASDHHYDTIVILGTNHTVESVNRISIYPGPTFRTPLGDAQVDEELARALVAQQVDAVLDASLHTREHSVEVQVPFIQALFPDARIVPVVIGSPDLDLCRRFGQALARVLSGRNALIVASSDLSHYPASAHAAQADRQTLEAIVTLDPERLQSRLKSGVSRLPGLSTLACGEGPILVALFAANQLGARRRVVVSYANSGDIPIGDPARAVGYGAVVMTGGDTSSDSSALAVAPPVDVVPLLADDKKALFAFARETIRRALTTETVPLARGHSPSLRRTQGVFVTLKRRGELRGCVGAVTSTVPLDQLVAAMALRAAFADERFKPVTLGELKDIEIEISLLTEPRVVPSAAIVAGRDGIVLRKDDRMAVFLPQVAHEQGWNRDELLENLALKAGLPADGWRTATLATFQAEVFSERRFR
jgi:MEMO1 family protein